MFPWAAIPVYLAESLSGDCPVHIEIAAVTVVAVVLASIVGYLKLK